MSWKMWKTNKQLQDDIHQLRRELLKARHELKVVKSKLEIAKDLLHSEKLPNNWQEIYQEIVSKQPHGTTGEKTQKG